MTHGEASLLREKMSKTFGLSEHVISGFSMVGDRKIGPEIELLELMLSCLEEHKDRLDNWSKTHFSNAIGSLSLNIHSIQQSTTSWLRLCLADFKKANLPVDQRDPNFQLSDPTMRDLTYDQLVGAVDSLGREMVRRGL